MTPSTIIFKAKKHTWLRGGEENDNRSLVSYFTRKWEKQGICYYCILRVQDIKTTEQGWLQNTEVFNTTEFLSAGVKIRNWQLKKQQVQKEPHPHENPDQKLLEAKITFLEINAIFFKLFFIYWLLEPIKNAGLRDSFCFYLK